MIRQFTSKTQQLGQWGEDQAVLFLMKQGFSTIERNSSNRHGEIDIAAEKANTQYFFEVKTGMQGSWFNPADNLTKEKLWKFHRAVEYYRFKKTADYKIQAILVLRPQSENGEVSIEIIDIS